jgi:DMSO/TMAO reductase YedYZ molybdopterin-dependent catalytic subunit
VLHYRRKTMEIRKSLPTHPVPDTAQRLAAAPVLRIDGLVATPQRLEPADLALLRRVNYTADFYCDEQWVAQEQGWGGWRLAEVIQLAGPLPTAQYVRVQAENYAVPLLLTDAEEALLVDTLNGRPLTLEHGAPWRLLLPGGRCYTSVKWVERLELSATRGANPAERLARARQRGRIQASEV